jgi:hypothetical protein
LAKPQTIHDLTAVSIDTGRDLVLVKGRMPNTDAIAFHLHRRTLTALIASLIRAHEQFPRMESEAEFPSQPLRLKGAAAIALGDGQPAYALELLLDDGLSLCVVVPDEAAKPLRQCLDVLIARIDVSRSPGRPTQD